IDNGIAGRAVYTDARAELSIPGFYRPTKSWDLLVVSHNQLVAAIEFKSQVGPSFGNNFNNRVEEALGNATDLNTAFREGAFGEGAKPFLGYFFVLEECPQSTAPVRFSSPHFPAMPEFENASYADRYEILCRKLVQEQL
ncbi:MAG: PaeR7I family type II restriction endonuclease, partial [Planctomycetota bacterium]